MTESERVFSLWQDCAEAHGSFGCRISSVRLQYPRSEVWNREIRKDRRKSMTEMRKIAEIHSDFDEKFGIPRQSGLIEELKAEIIFEPGFRDPNCFAGLEDFTHIWLLWEFFGKREWSPTVRPPRLGGEKRVGVFATRSPNRPNRIGLSSVRLLSVNPDGPNGPELLVAGPDLLDGTRIYDIKPYLP